MRSRKIPAPHSMSSRNFLQNPSGPLSDSTHYLICHSSTALTNVQDDLNIMLDNQRMQCTSKLGEMLSLPRNTQDESDKILICEISVASVTAIACNILMQRSDRQAVASCVRAGRRSAAKWSGLLAVSKRGAYFAMYHGALTMLEAECEPRALATRHATKGIPFIIESRKRFSSRLGSKSLTSARSGVKILPQELANFLGDHHFTPPA